jgi:hypothetical protein
MIADDSRRFGSRGASETRMVIALVVSLAVHLGGYAAYKYAVHKGWNKLPPPAWFQKFSVAKLLPQIKPRSSTELKPVVPPRPPPPDTPLTFIEVDPLLAEKEAPKDAKFYSAMNSKAANVEIKIQSDQPNIDGKQTLIPRTMDTLRPQPPPKPQVPEPPAPVAQKQAEVKAEQAKPKGGEKMGDLALAKPVPVPKPDTGKAETKTGEAAETKPERPRTIAEAVQRQNPSLSVEKMKQEGGVPNRRLEPSVNAIGTPFGQYDWEVFTAIEAYWNNLLSQQKGVPPGGVVVLEFRLRYDGTVSDMQVVENTVGEIFSYICQRAVKAPAPYGKWSPEMRKMIQEDYRQIRLTFHYRL